MDNQNLNTDDIKLIEGIIVSIQPGNQRQLYPIGSEASITSVVQSAVETQSQTQTQSKTGVESESQTQTEKQIKVQGVAVFENTNEVKNENLIGRFVFEGPQSQEAIENAVLLTAKKIDPSIAKIQPEYLRFSLQVVARWAK